MLLTRPQQTRFWREWTNACRVQGWTKANGWTEAHIDTERRALLGRAGFDSLTKVDHLAGYDRVLQELAALAQPANLEAQLREVQMPKTRLLYAIRHSGFSSDYIVAIVRDRWGHSRIEDLSEPQLLQLRNTLAARLSARHKTDPEPKQSTLEPELESVADNCPF